MKNSIKRELHNVPDIFETSTIPKGNEVPNGIIARIKEEAADINSYIGLSRYGTKYFGTLNTLIYWNSWTQTGYGDPYIQIEFKKGYVFPISYSFKGTTDVPHYAKEWYLYGLNDLNGEKIFISTNKSEGTSFCGGGSDKCASNNWATFAVNNKLHESFKYFRVECKVSTYTDKAILLSGIELFGLYSNDGRILKTKTNKAVSCHSAPRLSYFLILFFMIYIL